MPAPDRSSARTRRHGALAVASRLDLLRLVRAAPDGLDARQLALASGLAVSTVRFHLDRLIEAGLVVARAQPRSTPGRPRVAYAPASPADDRGGYEQLASALAANLADSPAERMTRAERAGRAWADERFRPRPGAEAGDASTGARPIEDAMRAVVGLFTEIGFDPELSPGPGGQRLLLHACPFLDVARAHPEVICTLHLGLLRGALERLAAPPLDTRLEPFAEPGLCVAHLTSPSASTRGAPGA